MRKTVSLSEYVDCRTIDSFQGDERDVIVFSCVRADGGGVGFVGDRHRMNVALTRAREALYVVADMDTLAGNADWKALREDAMERGVYEAVSADVAHFGAMEGVGGGNVDLQKYIRSSA